MLFIFVGAWGARFHNQNQWIQADLQTTHRIISVTTQGRYSRHNQWVNSYYVSYSQVGTRWETISTLFEANEDGDTKKTNLLPDNIVASVIRLSPNSWNTAIYMRFDVTGCAVTGTMSLYILWSQYNALSIDIRKIAWHSFFFLSFYSSVHYEMWMIIYPERL